MFRLVIALFFSLLLASFRSSSLAYQLHGYDVGQAVPQDVIVDLINNFGLKMLQTHNENNSNNIALSPYGAASVLIAIAEGVKGGAQEEIRNVLKLPIDKSVTRIGLRDVHRHLKSYFIPKEGFLAGLTLSHDNVTLTTEFEEILKFYGYDIESFNSPLYPDVEHEKEKEGDEMTTTQRSRRTTLMGREEDEKEISTRFEEETATTVKDFTISSTKENTKKTPSSTAKLDMTTTTEMITSTTTMEENESTTVLLETTTGRNDMETTTKSEETATMRTKTVEIGAKTTSKLVPIKTTSSPTISTNTQTQTSQAETATTPTPVTTKRIESGAKSTTKSLPIKTTSSPTISASAQTQTSQPGTTTKPTTMTTKRIEIGAKSTKKLLPIKTTSSPTISVSAQTQTSQPGTSTMATPVTTKRIEIDAKSTTKLLPIKTTSSPTISASAQTQTSQPETTRMPTPVTTKRIEIGAKTTPIKTTSSPAVGIETTTIPTSSLPETSTTLLTSTVDDGTERESSTTTSSTLIKTTRGGTSSMLPLVLTRPVLNATSKPDEEDTTRVTVSTRGNSKLISSTFKTTNSETTTTLKATSIYESTTASATNSDDDGSTATIELDSTTMNAVSATLETLTSTKLGARKRQVPGKLKEKMLRRKANRIAASSGKDSSKPEVRAKRSLAVTLNSRGNRNVREKRSVVDYAIARYYDNYYVKNESDDRKPDYYHYEKPSYDNGRFSFFVNGNVRLEDVDHMAYDTVLPFSFVPSLNAVALGFPLDNVKYHLLLLLPVARDGVDRLIADLGRLQNLRHILDSLRNARVKATIPSFMLKGYVILTPTLQKLGIGRIFEPRQADFSPMTSEKGTYVTNMEQAITVTIKNYVDPKTLMNNHRNLHQYGAVEFKADHPFLYFVIDSDIRVTLMAGKIVNPLNSRIK